MYLIVKGRISVKLNGDTVYLQDGDIFGEISLLDVPGRFWGYFMTQLPSYAPIIINT